MDARPTWPRVGNPGCTRGAPEGSTRGGPLGYPPTCLCTSSLTTLQDGRIWRVLIESLQNGLRSPWLRCVDAKALRIPGFADSRSNHASKAVSRHYAVSRIIIDVLAGEI